LVGETKNGREVKGQERRRQGGTPSSKQKEKLPENTRSTVALGFLPILFKNKQGGYREQKQLRAISKN
jgi:hypothetical protein